MALTFNEFKDKATKILNLNLDGYKTKRVQRRTDSLMRRHNIENYDQCLNLLKNDNDFKAAYLNHFTINTSEFYRNPKNFKYLETEIIPEIMNNNRNAKIWSSPCSNGSEPYTIAIILSKLSYNPGNYTIIGSDLDSNILTEAKKGIYNENAVQNVPPEILKEYFKPINDSTNKYQLSKKIIEKVKFEKIDLINESFKRNWDLILCRNFFIYLTKDIKEMLTHKYTSALKKGGYLFLGNTEFIFNPENFGLEKIYSSFYRKIGD
ncbi:MAG: CheR family methyltransferase [Halanaerobiaceae bacterium]